MANLDNILSTLQDSGAYELEPEQPQLSNNLEVKYYVQVLQNMGEKPIMADGNQVPVTYLVIGTVNVDDEGNRELWFAGPKSGLSLSLIDAHSVQVQSEKHPRMGRRMWRFDPATNQRVVSSEAATACSSNNGIFPRKEFIGKEVYNPRTQSYVRIGENAISLTENGQPTAMSLAKLKNGTMLPDICGTCPLSQWIDRKPPICGGQPRFIVWLHPQKLIQFELDSDGGNVEKLVDFPGGYCMITGSNSGVAQALLGVIAKKRDGGINYAARVVRNKTGREYRDIPALESFSRLTQHTERLMEALPDRYESLKTFIVGGSMSENGNIMRVTDDVSREEVAQMPYWLIKSPVSQQNPYGFPEILTCSYSEAPHFPVILRAGTNGFDESGLQKGVQTGSTNIAYPTLSDTPISEEEYLSFLQAKHAYIASSTRSIMMGLDTASDSVVRNFLPSQENRPQLMGSVIVSEDMVVDPNDFDLM